MTARETVIYGLFCPESGEVRYVGKTTQPLRDRLTSHRHDKRKTYRRSWLDGLAARGLQPEIAPLEVVPSGADWKGAEQFWIAYLKALGARLVNHTGGGEGLHLPDEATRRKLAANRLGKKMPRDVVERHREYMKGFRHTPESRAKLSAARAGKPLNLSPEQIAGLRARASGKKASDETRRKMSEAHKGKPRSAAQLAALAAGRAKMRSPEAVAKMAATKRAQAADSEWRQKWAANLKEHAVSAGSDCGGAQEHETGGTAPGLHGLGVGGR